ncbi:MAG: GNAT family N-acetyltransferase [Chloroflexota bacterium]|nr:MAG: GNAT family N-acetyltransferase [Chloroflexota bacterium]
MIYGERVRLRHVERGDLAKFVEWLNDPEVYQGLSIYSPLSVAEEEDWFEKMLKGPQDERPMSIEAKQDEGWQLIGNCSFFRIDWRNRATELGIFIGDKAFWDRGYGTEAINLLLKHGFFTLNLHRIFLRVYEDNPRAIRAYEKAGFIHEGRMRQAEFHDGQFHDVLLMSVIRREWTEELEE